MSELRFGRQARLVAGGNIRVFKFKKSSRDQAAILRFFNYPQRLAIFTSDSGCATKLNHEVETYNATTGAVNYWVKVPTVSHATDTVIYMCYGSASVTTDQSNKTAVWDSNFVSVYHLPDGSTLNASDSTANGNNGANSGTAAATGQIDGGGSFDGSSKFININHPSAFNFGNGDYTFEAWVKPASATAAQTIIGKDDSVAGGRQWNFSLNNDGTGTLNLAHFNGNSLFYWRRTPNSSVTTNVWNHVVAERQGAGLVMYINGSGQTLTDPFSTAALGTMQASGLDAYIGKRAYPGYNSYFNGGIDEVRISKIARSADWIQTEYNNQSSPSTFYTVSSATGGVVPAQLHWLVTDQLGTPRMIFDQTGSLANVSRHDYLPFGEELFGGPPNMPGTGGRLTTQGYNASDNVRQRFTLKERDIETGLDYFGARYYGSSQGRFTSTDPVTMTVDRLYDPQQINLYAYCRNNPLAFVDPNGEIIDYADNDSRKAYEEYEKFLNKDPKKYASELATLNQLKNSDVTYVINLGEKAGKGEGELTTDGNKIFININNVGGPSGETFSRNSRLAHELEHGRQFDSGELSFYKDPKTGQWTASPTTYDIGDEVKAFKAQQNVSQDSDYWTNKGGGAQRQSLLREFSNAKTDDERAGVLSRSAYPGRNQNRDSNVHFSPREGYKPGQLIRPTDRPNYFGRVHNP
jgi:RHS repeat-associated protein